MSHCWSESIGFREIPLVSESRICPECGGAMRIGKHRRRRLYTLDGPVCLICFASVGHCVDLMG